MKCPNCGFENLEKAKFCGKCGKAMKTPKMMWESMIASLVGIVIVFFFGLMFFNFEAVIVGLIAGLLLWFIIFIWQYKEQQK